MNLLMLGDIVLVLLKIKGYSSIAEMRLAMELD